MNNNHFFLLISILLIISLTVLSYLNYEHIIDFLLISAKSQKNIKILYIFFIFLCFLTPIPTTLIILLNGYLFEDTGFVISYLILIATSTILFLSSNKIYNLIFINNKNNLFSKNKFKLLNLSQNNLSIFISRFLIPFFFHNIYYGLTKIKLRKFIFIIIFAEIPFTYALNSIGNSLNVFNNKMELSIQEILFSADFYIPFIIIFALFIICNKYRNKINL
tara:strand:- start:1802 stop:2461 length:660 start_codon:yes stop_codon:yes gene_type:complete